MSLILRDELNDGTVPTAFESVESAQSPGSLNEPMTYQRLLLLLAFASCANPFKDVPTVTVDQSSGTVTAAAGGEITLASGAKLRVPAGAVAADVEIRVEAATQQIDGYETSSLVYTFTPEGLTFAVPVEVTIPFTGDDSDVMFWSKQDDTSAFEPVPTSGGNGVLIGQVRHFSRGFAGRDNSDACRSVRCEAESAPVCTDANTLTLRGRGTCVAGQCTYPSEARTCDCADGACRETAQSCANGCPSGTHCMGTVCVTDEPASCACTSGSHCDNQQCVPDVVVGCTPACASGEHCEGTVCVPDAPEPPQACSAENACSNGADCEYTTVCGPTNACGAGACEAYMPPMKMCSTFPFPCSDDSQCIGGTCLVMIPETPGHCSVGLCGPAPECLEADDCMGSPRGTDLTCRDHHCVPRGCESDANCQAHGGDYADFVCAPPASCVSDDECASPGTCDGAQTYHAGTCSETNAACGMFIGLCPQMEQTCQGSGAETLGTCVSDGALCTSDGECMDGTCVGYIAPSSGSCSLSGGSCFESADCGPFTQQCEGEQQQAAGTCTLGTCEPPPPPPCQNAADCTPYTGESSFCSRPGCETNTECVNALGDGATCNLSTHRCSAGICQQGPTCTAETVCFGGGGLCQRNGCSGDEECADYGGTCSDGACTRGMCAFSGPL